MQTTDTSMADQSERDGHMTFIHGYTSVSFCHCADAECLPAGHYLDLHTEYQYCTFAAATIVCMIFRNNAIDQAMLPIQNHSIARSPPNVFNAR